MKLPQRVKLVEVGPRDGLQNEKQQIPTPIKIELVNRLAQAGFGNVESASFVSPKWVPQMADGAQVMASIERKPGVMYSVLTPNMQGLEGALAGKADEIVIFAAASQTFSHKNINCSIEQSIERFVPVAKAALDAGVKVRGSISCSLGCPYEGDIEPQAVLEVAKRLRDLGCHELDIADTIGVGTAVQVQRVYETVGKTIPLSSLSGHFHDTYGQALANIYAALQMGVGIFHSSVAGLGGCPYAKGATGNVSTEDVVYMLDGLGIQTGVSLPAVVETGQWISQHLGRKAVSRAGNAIAAKQASLNT